MGVYGYAKKCYLCRHVEMPGRCACGALAKRAFPIYYMYIDVIVPLALPGLFTYRLPGELQCRVAVGCRVVVPFGNRKFYTAVVARLHNEPPAGGIVVKEVSEVVDAQPIVQAVQLDFWFWLANYYMCTPGEVMRAALPSGLKLESESFVAVNPAFTRMEELTERENKVWEAISRKDGQVVRQLERELKVRNLLPTVRRLMDKDAVVVKEKLSERFRPKVELHVRLATPFREKSRLSALFRELKSAPKQMALLRGFLDLSGGTMTEGLPDVTWAVEVRKAALLKKTNVSSSVFSALCTKGVFEVYSYEIGRRGKRFDGPCAPVQGLSEAQAAAYESILSCFSDKDVCLLHGVTSSGKTEIYIHLIERELARGNQVLYLLPEIALTTQLTERLARVFGEKMGVYHSKFSDAERVEVWKQQIGLRPYGLILGVRSALFLPFPKLGLVIVDEEHEPSYKQQDPAPRYQARDAAIVLAKRSGAKVLLGTATPAIETYYNAKNGKYGLVELTRRYGDVCLPNIVVEDVKELRRKKMMKTIFSPRLMDEIRTALERKEQVILFQNRRGFSPVLECRTCGWVPRCQICDVSLTYHQCQQRLICHYCGASNSIPPQCPNCGGRELRDMGYGTEKVESVVNICFPDVRTARMDLDTTRSRGDYERLLRDFQQGRTDILIGTQMVTKGLDFGRVRVVGILNADQQFNVPDFRAYERAYQMMAQVAGRAGRREQQGLVVLQTYQPDLSVVRQVVQNDYLGMYLEQLSDRKAFHFPPSCRLIEIYIKHRIEAQAEGAAVYMSELLKPIFGEMLLGPDRPAVARLQAQYIRKIILKRPLEYKISEVRLQLLTVRDAVKAHPSYKSTTIYFDVDPV